jgi:aldehyde:ferredoxin oxidoreductase
MQPVRILSINLTSGESRRQSLPPAIAEAYVGGRGWGAWLMYELLAPGVDPLDPHNALLFLTGPLTGTPIPGAGKFVVITKSPATGTFCDSYSSGQLAPALRSAGCEILHIVGKAARPAYLWIDDDEVEIQAGEALWGLDAFEAESWLRRTHADDHLGVAVIGPAGENLVSFATIGSDYYRHAARGGVGAVMGSKNLKAVVVRGTGAVPVAFAKRVAEAQTRLVKRAQTSSKVQAKVKYGTTSTFEVTNAAGMLPTHNFRRGTFPEGAGKIDPEAIRAVTVGHTGCYACVMPCGRLVEIETDDGVLRLEGPEYETIAMMGSNLGVNSLSSIVRSNLACDRLGLDTISAGNVLGFAMACAQEGKLSPYDELELHFGQSDTTALLEDIAYRRGIGALFAQGVKGAAERIGGGTAYLAMHVKGLELPAYDPRAEFGAGLVYAVTARGGCHRRAWPPRVTRLSGQPPDTVVGKAAIVKDLFDRRTILHSMLVCDFHHRPLSVSLEEYAQIFSDVTGDRYSVERLLRAAERIETTTRLFNVREGFTRGDDRLPPRLLEEPLEDGPAAGRVLSQEGLDHMLDEYYAMRGWDDQGIPLSETLERYTIPIEV